MKAPLRVGVALLALLSSGASLRSVVAPARLPTLACSGESCEQRDLVCSWPFIVTAETLNIAYPDPNATYWATPFALAADEFLELRGHYPSARFMAVTLYDAGGNLIEQLSDLDIPPDPGSENPFATATVSPLAGDHWRVRVVPAAARESGATELRLGAGQHAGWLVYRVYLGNPAGDAAGGVALPTLDLHHRGRRVRVAAPCARQLPGTTIGDLLQSQMPEPVVASGAPTFVRLAASGGLFENAANAYLSAFALHEPGVILVVRGLLPSFPDTGAGESVVGSFDLRYASITTNADAKPYPTYDGVFDAELPLDDAGYFTVVVARTDDVPLNASTDASVVVLGWGASDAQTVIIRNMLPSSGFPYAVQDVTPSTYGSASDAAETMGDYYPAIVACTRAQFEAGGARGCFVSAGVPYPEG